MATVKLSNYNPVPRGVAGGGEAFVLGDTNGPLKLLMNQQAMALKQQQVTTAEKAKQEAAALNDYRALPQLSTEGWLYQDEITKSAQDTL